MIDVALLISRCNVYLSTQYRALHYQNSYDGREERVESLGRIEDIAFLLDSWVDFGSD
jgi:hypothetical protein